MITTFWPGHSFSSPQTWTADQTLNDNVKLLFGDGGDASIHYDGTDLKFDPKVVGSGKLDFLGDVEFQQAAVISTLTGDLTLAPAEDGQLTITTSVTNPASEWNGLKLNPTISETGSSNSQSVFGIDQTFAFASGNTQNWTGSVAGMRIFANFNSTANVYTVDEFSGLFISNAVNLGSATLAIQHGILIGTLTGGTVDYPITIGTGGDASHNLIHVGVSGDPIFGWGETLDQFTFNKNVALGDDDELRFGVNLDYWLVYNDSGTQLQLRTSNSDGSGTDGTIFDVQDGVDDVRFAGGISLDNVAAPTSGLALTGNIDLGSLGKLINADEVQLDIAGTEPASTANEVSLYGVDVGALTVLGIACEIAVAVETDETKFSHKIQVRINQTDYFMMLTQT